MSLRTRERITRSYDTTTCEACGSPSYEHNLSRARLGGGWYNLCTTCFIEQRNEGEQGLKAFMRLRTYFGDSEINQDLYDKL